LSLLSTICTPPPQSTLLPYTTLFRSRLRSLRSKLCRCTAPRIRWQEPLEQRCSLDAPILWYSRRQVRCRVRRCRRERPHQEDRRSEEHTSELQSQSNLVCRLLLEKKK